MKHRSNGVLRDAKQIAERSKIGGKGNDVADIQVAVCPPVEAVSNADEPGGTPETVAAETEQQRIISRALDAIPQDQRKLIEDAFFFGFTHSELAERHRLPLGTVKTRIRTGLQMLRGQLTETGIVQ